MLSHAYSGGEWNDGGISYYNAIAHSPTEDAIFVGGGLQSSSMTGVDDLEVPVITKIGTDTNTQIWSRVYIDNRKTYAFSIKSIAVTDTSSDYKLVVIDMAHHEYCNGYTDSHFFEHNWFEIWSIWGSDGRMASSVKAFTSDCFSISLQNMYAFPDSDKAFVVLRRSDRSADAKLYEYTVSTEAMQYHTVSLAGKDNMRLDTMTGRDNFLFLAGWLNGSTFYI